MVTVGIYVSIGEDGYVTGWSSTPSEVDGEAYVEVEEGHEVMRNPFVFKYVDEALVRDAIIEEEDEELTEIEQLRLDNEVLAMAVMELSARIMSVT